MKQVFYIILLLLAFAGIPLLIFAIVNTLVSIKYEANDGCISSVTNQNLCNQLLLLKIFLALDLILLILLIRKQFKKDI
jgi:hypothetical protein